MRGLTVCALGVVAVIVAGVSLAQDPAGPAFTSRFQFTADYGRSMRVCVEQRNALPSGRDVFGYSLLRADNPFLPSLDTPIERFLAPSGWRWRADPTKNAWVATTTTRVPFGQNLCFRHPITRKLTAGEVEHIIAQASNEQALYSFVSRQSLSARLPGQLPLVFNLPKQTVTGTFTSPLPACGLAQNFTTELRIGALKSVLSITEPRTGDKVRGTVDPRTRTFRLTGETEVYEGGAHQQIVAGYAYTRTYLGSPCTAGYFARLALREAGIIKPACDRPEIGAPTRVAVRAGESLFFITVRCQRKVVAGVRVNISVRSRDRTRRLGSIKTRATPVPVKLRISGGHGEDDLLLWTPPQMGLKPAVDVVDLFFPPRR